MLGNQVRLYISISFISTLHLVAKVTQKLTKIKPIFKFLYKLHVGNLEKMIRVMYHRAEILHVIRNHVDKTGVFYILERCFSRVKIPTRIIANTISIQNQ